MCYINNKNKIIITSNTSVFMNNKHWSVLRTNYFIFATTDLYIKNDCVGEILLCVVFKTH